MTSVLFAIAIIFSRKQTGKQNVLIGLKWIRCGYMTLVTGETMSHWAKQQHNRDQDNYGRYSEGHFQCKTVVSRMVRGSKFTLYLPIVQLHFTGR